MPARPHGRGSLPTSSRPLLALALAAALAAPAPAAAGPLTRALDHLAARQDAVAGGFSARGGTEADQTTWAALAVAAAGEDPDAWTSGGPSLSEALGRLGGSPGDGEPARLAVAAVAVGRDPRDVGGRNLVRRLLLSRGPDGAIGDDVSATAWALLALRAAGLPPSSRSVVDQRRAIERAQRADGGWSTLGDLGGSSAPLTTADAVQALVAAGRDPQRSPALRRARGFLRRAQNGDGGFPTVVGGQSTALTTAWVTLAIRALGERSSRPPWDRAGGPLALLVRLQGDDGGVRNSASSSRPSVWATSQAALALAGKPLPLAAPAAGAAPAHAPRVTAREPRGGGRLDGALVVRFADDAGGTGIDPGSVRLRVGRRDVTGLALVTTSVLTLPGDAVPAGRARVRLTLADRAGNATTARWRIVATGR